jgi:hypothetical protein
VAADLCTVATVAHIAPTAAVIPAEVDEQPSAGIAAATAEVRKPFEVRQKSRGRMRHRAERSLQRFAFGPLPAKTVACFGQLKSSEGLREL